MLLLLPWYNNLTGKVLTFDFQPQIVLVLFSIALLTGLVSGSYPALYLTKFSAVKVLKGKINSTFGEIFARRGLVVFQFSISIIMIVAVGVIYKQLDYMQSKNLGYNKDNVMIIGIQDGLVGKVDVFLEKAKQLGLMSYFICFHEFVFC